MIFSLGYNTINVVQTRQFVKAIHHKQEIKQSKETEIKIKSRKWIITDFEYWQNYGISKKTLEHFNVVPVDFFWIDGVRSSRCTLTFSYEFGNGYRDIYQPMNKPKFLGNTKASKHIYGLNNARENKDNFDELYIVSSLKEVMMLWEQFNILAIAPQSENSFIPDSVISRIKKHFDVQIIYDFDYSGIIAGIKHSKKYKIPSIYTCPVIGLINGKDLTDMYKNGNGSYIKKHLETQELGSVNIKEIKES